MECSAEERAEISAAPGAQVTTAAEPPQQPQQQQQEEAHGGPGTGGSQAAGAEQAQADEQKEQAEEEEPLVQYGPALPPPPDALTLLGQYANSWQQRDQSPRQPARDTAAGGPQPEQDDGLGEAKPMPQSLPVAAEAEDGAEEPAGEHGNAALQPGSEQQPEQQPAEAAAGTAAAAAGVAMAEAGSAVEGDEEAEGRPAAPAEVPPDVWAIMRKLAKFVQVCVGGGRSLFPG